MGSRKDHSMNPYREAAPRPVEVKPKPRGWWKTFKLKMLIRWKGKWRERWQRCPYCKKTKWQLNKSWTINPEPFFHMMRCPKARYDERERHTKNYWYAVADNLHLDDEIGPLR